MKHYGIAEWVDFAREVVNDADESKMRGHLETGCNDCADVVSFSQKFNGICRVMAMQAAPDDVVRRARAIFPITSKAPARRVFRIPVELIYDSFLASAPAGLRSAWQVGWQALYRAGDCSLDLRIEPELHSARAAVIGQISNHARPEDRLSGLPVQIQAGKLLVAETRSNEYGEFQMEYQQQKRMQLCVYLQEGTRCIQVALKSVGSTEKPAAIDRLEMGLNPQADEE